MVDARVGRRYALALFGAASHLDVVASVEDDLRAIVSLVKNDPEFRQFLLSPYTSRDERVRICEKLFSDRVTALSMQVLRVVLVKRREAELPSIFDEFVRIRREAQNVTHVTVTSAIELTEAQRTALVAKLSVRMGGTIEADYRVDPRVIGGVRVAYGNHILDGSVRGALDRLRERLTYDLLKQA